MSIVYVNANFMRVRMYLSEYLLVNLNPYIYVTEPKKNMRKTHSRTK